MTIQEAIRTLKMEMLGDSEQMEYAKQIAIKAVEKQIPKKPITETVNRGISVSGEYDIDFNYLCPNCNTVVGDYETDDVFYKFCPDCGQALDFGDLNGIY